MLKNSLNFYNLNISEEASTFSHLTIEFHGGKVTAIVSANPRELTSFFHIFTKPLSFSFGEIVLNGKEIKNKKNFYVHSDLIRITTKSNFFERFSIINNIYSDSYYTFSSKKKQQQYDNYYKAIEYFDIDIAPYEYAKNVHNEDLLLLELIQAYLSPKKLIILYDTLSILNTINTCKALNIIKELKAQGKVLIYISSKVESALSIADSIAFLKNQTVYKTFSVESISKNPHELISLVSGINAISSTNTPQYETDSLILSLTNLQKNINATHQLQEHIQFFQNDLKKILQANSCEIQLFEITENDPQSPNLLHINQASVKIMPKYLKTIMQDSSPKYFYSNQRNFHDIFSLPENINTVICAPLSGHESVYGLIILLFNEFLDATKRNELYLSAFSETISSSIAMTRLSQNSVLLKEAHHRIKNNLQIIISILQMHQASSLANSNTENSLLFDTTISRIKSIAAIHDLLSKNKYSGNTVNLNDIVNQIISFYSCTPFEILHTLPNIKIPHNKATNISMLINELVNNCVKHAFPNNIDFTSKVIMIEAVLDEDGLTLIVTDNGIGLPDNYSMDNSTGIGFSIIQAILASNSGTITYRNNPAQSGCSFTVRLPATFLSIMEYSTL